MAAAPSGIAGRDASPVPLSTEQLLLRAEELLREGRATDPEAGTAAADALASARTFRDESLIARAHRLRGLLLADAGHAWDAVGDLNAALEIRRHQSDPENLLQSLYDLARVRLDLGDRKGTEELLAEMGKETAAGGPRELRALEIRARIDREAGRYAEALAAANQAREKCEAAGDSRSLVEILNLVGELEWFKGRFGRSRDAHLRALDLATRSLRDGHPTIGSTLADLALAEFELGDVDAAREHELRALEVTRNARGDDHPETNDRKQNLANLFLDGGDYARALELYESVRAFTEQRFGPDSDEAAHVSYNLGLLFVRMGDVARARQGLTRTREIWERERGSSHPYVARASEVLATIALEGGDLTAARSALQRSAAIRDASPDTQANDLAWTLVRLADVARRMGDASEARQLVDRVERLLATQPPELRVSAARMLLLLGDVELALGRTQESAGHYAAVVGSFRRLFNDQHPVASLARARLAAVRLREGRIGEAFRDAEDAEVSRQDHLRRTVRYLAERQALNFAAQPPFARDVILSAAISRHASAAQRGEALGMVASGRALVLDEMAARHARSGREISTPLMASLESARRRLARLLYREMATSDEARAAALESARDEVDLIERQLAREETTGREDLSPPKVTAALLARRLPPQSALVSFIRYRDVGTPEPRSSGHYLAFVLPAGQTTPAVRALGPSDEIDAAVRSWRATNEDLARAFRDPVAAERDGTTPGRTLTRLVWDPLRKDLEGASVVFLVPDGQLNLISFDALAGHGREYLVEGGPRLHYLSSERELLRPPRAFSETGSLLALGGPDYDGAAAIQADARPGFVATRGPDVPLPGDACARSPLRFPFLPDAAAEAAEVADIWKRLRPRAPSLLLIGRDATVDALRRAVPGRSLLHIATHGFFARNDCPGLSATRGESPEPPSRQATLENPLFQVGLAFAGANRSSAGGDQDEAGLLTAAEVATLDLSEAQWVVLSACGSGLGRIQEGEGVVGLRRAFAIAGADTVLMSLWSVEDTQARLWMRDLYDGRLARHLSTSEAVRRANVMALARLRDRYGAAPPALWAAFVAAGDWR